jgi:hypothetical protein
LTPVAAPNVFLAGDRLRKSGFGAMVLRDVAWRPSVETGASVPGYSGGFAACVVVSYPQPEVSGARLTERLTERSEHARNPLTLQTMRKKTCGVSIVGYFCTYRNNGPYDVPETFSFSSQNCHCWWQRISGAIFGAGGGGARV